MATEIERKFLVEQPPADLSSYPSERIEQGYLVAGDEAVEVRVRRRGERFFLTVKSGGGRARVEEELEIEPQRFRSLWTLTEGRRLEKIRYRIPLERSGVLELDVYDGALEGLVVAEVEFVSEEAATAFEPPAWLGPEVTEDPRYKNRRLAVEGLP